MVEYKKFTNECGIYCFTNKINGKCYVGQAMNLKKRLRAHYAAMKRQDIPNMLIYKAVAKYGIENFDLEILEFCDSTLEEAVLKKLLDDKEKEYIQSKNAYIPNGYNQTLGGDAGVLGYKMTDEQKKKISDGLKAHNEDIIQMIYAWNFETNTEYVCGNIEIAAERTGIYKNTISKVCNNSYLKDFVKIYTFAYTEEELFEKRDKIKILIDNGLDLASNDGKFKSGDKCVSGSPVIEIDPDTEDIIKEFPTVKEASNFYSISESAVHYHLNGHSKLCRGKIFRYKDPNYQKKNRNTSGLQKAIKNSAAKRCKKVDQFDLNGVFIKTFNSIKEAAESVNTEHKSISRVCTGKLKTCKRYIWKYHE